MATTVSRLRSCAIELFPRCSQKVARLVRLDRVDERGAVIADGIPCRSGPERIIRGIADRPLDVLPRYVGRDSRLHEPMVDEEHIRIEGDIGREKLLDH